MTYQMKKLPLNTKTLILATVAVVIIGLAGLLIPRLSGAQQCTSVETYDFFGATSVFLNAPLTRNATS